jgi:TorA maturation chaperone TorD
MSDPAIRRSLYVLFARLLSGAPDAELYGRLQRGGLRSLAAVQGIDLSSDLLDEEDPEAAAAELGVEWARLDREVSLRASDYDAGSSDPVAALGAFLREHRLSILRGVDLPCDHLAVALGVMGELAGQADAGADAESPVRARAFFLRHLQPWAQRALAELSARADRRFYRGVAAMVSAFLEAERRRYAAA